ncbi:hypothetical protein [Actinophytocola oryzae]|uniref:Uncharacterized protein n=1 Tax=Actinophytocola oryzae TaxID=502181 RepID=A0A4R7V2Y3_9PSEU|nr:hypothetical protein [Actinophytocola oryzae]TDV43210.1 hypothetical protein CLV71_116144 [Actinophytocola oryzae]
MTPDRTTPARKVDLGLVVGTAVGAAAVAVGATVGLWFLPFVAGAVLGAVSPVRRPGFAATAVALLVLGPLAWGAVLFSAMADGDTIGGTARTVAALAGLPAAPAVTIALTLVVALLQVVAGALSGRSVVGLGLTRRGVPGS